jgi:hypothetical protein
LVERRVLVTNNVVDFEILRRRREVDGHAFPHLTYTSDQRFPRNRQFLVSLANALAPAAREHRASKHGGTYWLK